MTIFMQSASQQICPQHGGDEVKKILFCHLIILIYKELAKLMESIVLEIIRQSHSSRPWTFDHKISSLP